MRLILGVDPGINNLGIAWLNVDTNEASLRNYDLGTWNGKKHELKHPDYGPCIRELFISLNPLLKQCEYVGIERLPPSIKNPKTGKSQLTNKNVFAVMCMVEMAIRCLAPSIIIFDTAPVSVRAYMNTGARGGTYAESKERSALANTLPPFQMTQAKRIFTKQGKFHVDAIEAVQIALYVRANLQKLIKGLNYTNLPPRIFYKNSITTPVCTPALKPKPTPKKRVKSKTESAANKKLKTEVNAEVATSTAQLDALFISSLNDGTSDASGTDASSDGEDEESDNGMDLDLDLDDLGLDSEDEYKDDSESDLESMVKVVKIIEKMVENKIQNENENKNKNENVMEVIVIDD